MFRLSVLSFGFLIPGVSLALTPAAFAVGPVLEALWFPVVRDVQIMSDEQTPNGKSSYTKFRKVRQCRFLALVWYDRPVRLNVNFEPDAGDAPSTRPLGDQYSGPSLVRDLQGLRGSRAHVYHCCHPLWTTITTFYKD